MKQQKQGDQINMMTQIRTYENIELQGHDSSTPS